MTLSSPVNYTVLHNLTFYTTSRMPSRQVPVLDREMNFELKPCLPSLYYITSAAITPFPSLVGFRNNQNFNNPNPLQLALGHWSNKTFTLHDARVREGSKLQGYDVQFHWYQRLLFRVMCWINTLGNSSSLRLCHWNWLSDHSVF